MNTHTLWFHPQIKELLALLRDQFRFRVVICNGKTSRRTNRRRIGFAHVIVFLLSPSRAIIKYVLYGDLVYKFQKNVDIGLILLISSEKLSYVTNVLDIT